jgi:dTDP-4-dehydrorhamnose 3,5-epimerase
MKLVKPEIAGLALIDPQRFADDRGFFVETFQRQRYLDAGIAEEFIQGNHSRSRKGVLRGLHFQMMRPQAQIVTVIHGRVFDVAVDVRRGSSTFGKWFGAFLSEQGPCQLYMSAGFAHGFYVVSDLADIHYMVSRAYDPNDEAGIRWNDPEIGISWPDKSPLLSSRDAAYPLLRDVRPDCFPRP